MTALDGSRPDAVVALLLAAGESKRMGRPKQLLPWRGSTLVRHAAETALAANLRGLVVVVGSHAAEVRDQLAELERQAALTVVENPDYASGQASSLRAGIAALPPETGAALVMLVDQPLVGSALLDELAARWRATRAPLAVPRHAGRRGNPVLIDHALFPELLKLRGDTGARPLFERYAAQIAWVEADASILADVDSPEAYQSLLHAEGNL